MREEGSSDVGVGTKRWAVVAENQTEVAQTKRWEVQLRTGVAGGLEHVVAENRPREAPGTRSARMGDEVYRATLVGETCIGANWFRMSEDGHRTAAPGKAETVVARQGAGGAWVRSMSLGQRMSGEVVHHGPLTKKVVEGVPTGFQTTPGGTGAGLHLARVVIAALALETSKNHHHSRGRGVVAQVGVRREGPTTSSQQPAAPEPGSYSLHFLRSRTLQLCSTRPPPRHRQGRVGTQMQSHRMQVSKEPYQAVMSIVRSKIPLECPGSKESSPIWWATLVQQQMTDQLRFSCRTTP